MSNDQKTDAQDQDISVGDIIRAADHLGRAFPILYFQSADAPPTRFVVVDCDRHFDALDCPECGHRPKTIYSTDRNGGLVDDGMAWLSLSCGTPGCREKQGAITIFIGNALFDRARGAMGSVARSWWNAMRDRDGHPDDLGTHGGILVTWESFQKYMQEQGQ